ncbi:MAG TPA: YceI family protein [Bacteroidia bacterium]|jgi:polyisoprenoid-binding protein YceI|nr:YceI family protein [Bacteroidia bacterium]
MNSETKWVIDPTHSQIACKVRHLMIAYVKGLFKDFEASIYTKEKDFTTAKVELTIDANSISTGDINRDAHLKSGDFLDVKNHPKIIFVSKTIEKEDEHGNHTLWGELTIKGITKPVKLNVRFGGMAIDPSGIEKAGFEIKGKIYRTDWGLVWNATMETGGLIVNNEVLISSEIELHKDGQIDLKKELEPIGIQQEPNMNRQTNIFK